MLVDVLINLIRERRAICDPSDSVYRDLDAIPALWKDIATEIKYKESDCKDKWHRLRSNFMREKRKITTQQFGSANIKTKKWLFYNAMEFLILHVIPRATSSNVPPPPDEDNSSDIDHAAPDDYSLTTNITDAPDIVRSQEIATNIFRHPVLFIGLALQPPVLML
ncbi:uncharacterized protein LOC143020221 [Oratosquilla oratoria]|uniref:uncharacterized protein LOC143020221 n=1 Tax=Oratosquilla oratoria TaxID=337810 RepID=UPI003F76FD00